MESNLPVTQKRQVADVLASLGVGFDAQGEGLPLAVVSMPQARSIQHWTCLNPADRVIRLFDYQQDIAQQMQTVVSARERALVSLPTGAGKTRTAVAAFLGTLEREPRSRWAWLAPTKELLSQAYEAVLDCWRQLNTPPRIIVSYGGEAEPDASLWLTTPQAVISEARAGRRSFTAVLFDEAHQVAAPTFHSAFSDLGNEGAAMLGLSATPGRLDDEEDDFLRATFGNRLLVSSTLGEDPVATLQERGILARLRFRAIGEQPDSDEDRLRLALERAHVLAEQGRRILVFTATVAQAIAGSIWLNSRAIRAAYVDGQLDDAERRSRLAAFGTGGISVMLNQRLLATGYDCPAVTDIILVPRIGSPILFEQMVGRVARGPLTGGASVGHVWQFDDHLAIHGMPKSYYRFNRKAWD